MRAFIFQILVPKASFIRPDDEILKLDCKRLKEHKIEPHRETSVKVKIRYVRHCVSRNTVKQAVEEETEAQFRIGGQPGTFSNPAKSL